MKTCYHCKDECQEEIHFDEKVFCCTGCRTVYELLNENELGKFYAMEERPGVRPASKNREYDFLELEEMLEKLYLFNEGGVAKVKFNLPQIHCSSCLWLLERLSKINPAVISSQVNFVQKECTITFRKDEMTLKDLALLLSRIGYAPDIQLNEKKSKKVDRKIFIQIGIAGFCFGNVMLLSFPEYIGLDERHAEFQMVFTWLSLILSIPVLLYAAKDYLISAFKSIRAKAINIDVPISLGILALFSRSTFEVVTATGPGYFDSFTGLIFFLLIGKWFQQRTYASINFERDYKSYFPIAVTRKSEGIEEIIPLEKLEVGNELTIHNNELIPADSVIVSGKGNIDYSFVTGESACVRKTEGDRIFAGGRQDGPEITIRLIKDVENSYLVSLWNNPAFRKEAIRNKISDQIAKYFTIAIIIIAVIGGVVWSQIDAGRMAFVVTSILIVACPCALALSVPFTYGNGIRIFGKNSIFLRSSDVVEPMADVTDIVFDKTGTITDPEQTEVMWDGEELSSDDLKAIFNICRQSTHPMSKAIASHLSLNVVDLDEVEEVSGSGLKAVFNGVKWKVGSYKYVGAESIDDASRVYISKDGRVLGSYRFSQQYREGLFEMFSGLGIYNLHILSGDNDAEQERLQALMPSKSNLLFNQKPEDKLNYIKSLQSEGKKVMMLGDGLNDAGALAQSDIGFSVVDDVHSFTPSSDGILKSDQLVNLPSTINFAVSCRKVVRASYVFSLLYNIVGMYFALTGMLTPLVAAILMPLSSISIVVLATVLTNVYARRLFNVRGKEAVDLLQ